MIKKNTPKERRIILKHADDPKYSNRIDCYLREGGYAILKKSLKMKPEEIGEEVLQSGVRGRGGAGFPAGMKWKFWTENLGSLYTSFVMLTSPSQEPLKIGKLSIRILTN